jgi:Fibronectin type III domain
MTPAPGEFCVMKRLLQNLGTFAGLALLLAGCNDQSASPAVSTSGASPKNANTTAVLSWEAPTTNTNGSALTDLAGYRIYYGESPRTLSESVQIKTVGVQTYVIDNLPAGTWYFAIMAVTSAGRESGLSNVVSMTIGS